MKRFLLLASPALLALASTAAAKPAPRTLAEMIAAGHYRTVNENFTADNFPVKAGRFSTEGVELVDFGRPLTTHTALDEMRHRGFRPATIEELLAYGAEHPDAMRNHPIVALGTRWHDTYRAPFVPVIVGDVEADWLVLKWDDTGHGWEPFHRFLAVRTSSTSAKPAPRTLTEMIKMGNYFLQEKRLDDAHVRVKAKRFTDKNVTAIGFKHELTTQEVLSEIDRRGFRPALIEELLAYGISHFKENNNKLLIAMGSTITMPGNRTAYPCMTIAGDQKSLDVCSDQLTGRWESEEDGAFYLVVPK